MTKKEIGNESKMDWSAIESDRIKSMEVYMLNGIKHVKIDNLEDKKIIEFAGLNGTGKTTMVRANLYAFGGADLVGEKPLRDGEEYGFTKIVTEKGITAFRTFKDAGNVKGDLKATGPNDEKILQGDLNEYFGKFAFDPLKFKDAKNDEQIKIFKQVAGEEQCKKLDDLQAKYDKKYQERAFLNQQIKKQGNLPKMEKVEEIDTASIHKELADVDNYNDGINKQHSALSRLKDVDLANAVKEVTTIEGEIKRLTEQLASKKALVSTVENQISSFGSIPEKKDASEIREKLANAETQNRRAQEYKNYLKEVEKRAKDVNESNNLTEELKSIELEITKAAKEIKFPVEGAKLTSTGIRVNGIPFKELCGKEQISFSVKVGIALNKKMKVLYIHNGEALDKASFNQIKEGLPPGYQLVVATVTMDEDTPGHGDAYILHNGELLSQPLPAEVEPF